MRSLKDIIEKDEVEVESSAVVAYEEDVVIPTYGIGAREKNPIFLEKRVYQGSSGVVYPNAVIEKIFDEKRAKVYRAILLENRYLKIMILPELGGRVQMAFDKTMRRHFVYFNEVIKPALVGLTGPWISGGIEFNWPQHHRPSTFEPIDSLIETNSDGSKTVWVNEIERMFRGKGMAGFTLYPDKAYLEIKVRLFNRTSLPQTFLWWANPAVKVNDEYQSVFPPDVHAVFDHGKRDVSSFPIAKGTYYKVDYSAGVDISKYKNIPVPTSYMAVSSKYDFVGCYENDSKGGMLHIADHHFSPGKKQWTWGHGDFGLAWDRNLTDENGPYIELMAGVYTDNQPDFSWLQPYEEKSWEQYFLPYKNLGYVKNASKDIVISLETIDNTAIIKVYASSVQKSCKIVLHSGSQEIYTNIIDLDPYSSFEDKTDFPGTELELELFIFDSNGNTLISYRPEIEKEGSIPETAKPIPSDPAEVETIEELFLCGKHLEQYRHASYNPTIYYKEALKRSPGDIRNNNAMGLWLFRRGQFEMSEKYFRTSIKTITKHNPNPFDGEGYFNLGLSLFYQRRLDEAYDSFYKACWNDSCQAAGYFHLAIISSCRNEYGKSLEFIEKSFIHNSHNQKARHLKSILLRHLCLNENILKWTDESLKIDRFNFGIIYERCLYYSYLKDKRNYESSMAELLSLTRNNVHSFIEYSIDYAQAGFYEEAIQFLQLYNNQDGDAYPIVFYLLAYFHQLNGNQPMATNYIVQAEECKSDYCFPNRLEELQALKTAISIKPGIARAYYYLGNLWYGNLQYENAIKCWETSTSLDPGFPTAFRNLALGYYNKQGRREEALQLLEKAFKLDTSDGRILMELDQLYKEFNYPFSTRLDFLNKYSKLVNERDDLYLEKITLLNQSGNYKEAYDLLNKRKFHPWEGGEGKVVEQFKICRINLAILEYRNNKFNKAIQLLKDCETYPENLGEGKLPGTLENNIHFWLGIVNEKKGEIEESLKYFTKASEGNIQPSNAMYYNDQKPDMIFYQGLAFNRLNKFDEAEHRFRTLIEFGENQAKKTLKIDYFAVSLPDLLIWDKDLNLKNVVHCNYLSGLGYLGIGNSEKAKTLLSMAASLDKNHQGVQIHLELLDSFKFPQFVN